MKTIKFKFIAFIAILASAAACSIDNGPESCFYNATMSTTAVTGPETTTVNTPITFNVTFRVASDCGVFNRFLETNGYPKQIVALVDYPGCECTPSDIATLTRPYTFTANAAGTYELKFVVDTNVFITKTVTVTAE